MTDYHLATAVGARDFRCLYPDPIGQRFLANKIARLGIVQIVQGVVVGWQLLRGKAAGQQPQEQE